MTLPPTPIFTDLGELTELLWPESMCLLVLLSVSDKKGLSELRMSKTGMNIIRKYRWLRFPVY